MALCLNVSSTVLGQLKCHQTVKDNNSEIQHMILSRKIQFRVYLPVLTSERSKEGNKVSPMS